MRAPVGAAEGLVPFQYDVEIPEMKSFYQIELQTGLAHLSFLMKSGTELEVQAVVDIETLITKEKQSELITGTEDREYDINWLNHIPGIAGIRLQKPDDLWNIAKKFHTTVQDIKTVNELSEEEKNRWNETFSCEKITDKYYKNITKQYEIFLKWCSFG